MVGYLVFLVPTALAYSVSPATRRGIPSIMCGFAVLFALILTLYVLPLAATRRVRSGTVDPARILLHTSPLFYNLVTANGFFNHYQLARKLYI